MQMKKMHEEFTMFHKGMIKTSLFALFVYVYGITQRMQISIIN